MDAYQPIIVRRGSTYEVTATRYGHSLRAEFSRIGNERGYIRAEVSTFLDDNGAYRGGFSLNSPTSAKPYIDKVEKKRSFSNYGIVSPKESREQWEDFLDDAINITIDTYRQGEPEVLISDRWQDKVGDDVFLIEPYLLLGQHNTVYGDPSSAKSLMALWWSVLLDTGYVHAENVDVVSSRANCLYLDWETSDVEILRRVRWLHAGIGEEAASNLVYRNCHQPLASETNNIRDIVYRRWGDKVERPILIIVDSLGMATEGGLSDEDVVAPYFAALRALQQDLGDECTTLTITHTNKDGDLFGSQYIRAESRNIWQLKSSVVDRGQIHVNAFHRKSNSVGASPPRAYSVKFVRDQVSNQTSHINIAPQSVISTEEGVTELSTSRLILEVVEHDGPINRDGLVEAIGDLRGTNLSDKKTAEKLSASVRISTKRHLVSNKLLERDGLLMLPIQDTHREEQEEWIPL